jgi:DNA polymerase III subunit delta'
MEILETPSEPRANLDLLGQDAAEAVLARALRSGRLPHGWLFSGPEGIGKATLAYRFARALLAGPEATGPTLALSPDHPVFRQVAQGAHPDLTVIEPERDSRTGRVKSEIPVASVRAATQALHATAAMGGWRVVVIDGAERLNRNAANALLKSLEEPPPAAVLLLISHRPAQVAPTVRSRCAKLPLARLPDALVIEWLARWAPEIDFEQRSAIALLARGSFGRALELACEDWLALYRRLAESLADAAGNRPALYDLALALARQAEHRGFVGPLGLIQELLGRIVASGIGRLGPALFTAEPVALGRLVERRPLDRWAALWEKVGQLAAAVDGLNLDRAQALLHILTLLAPGSELDEAGTGGAILGALDVPG